MPQANTFDTLWLVKKSDEKPKKTHKILEKGLPSQIKYPYVRAKVSISRKYYTNRCVGESSLNVDETPMNKDDEKRIL